MIRLLLSVAIVCFAGFVSAEPQSYESYLLPQKAIEELSKSYDLQIVPSDRYLVEYAEKTSSPSLFDIIPVPNPITALTSIASTALSIGSWLFWNSGFIVLGAALLFGFCAFTSYCTLTIEAPLTAQIHNLNHYIPYLDNIEHLLRQAYDKYHK